MIDQTKEVHNSKEEGKEHIVLTMFWHKKIKIKKWWDAFLIR